MKKPRPYQLETLEAVRESFRKRIKGVIVERPTGTGKGLDVVLIAKMVREKKGRVLVLLNRDILVAQTVAEMAEMGLYSAREQAESRASLSSDVVVASIQSLQGKWLQRFPRDYFRLVICDEVHGSASSTFKRCLDHFESAYHVGFTATPERHDKAGLWKGYQDICYRMTLMDAIDQGWLCGFEFVDLDCPVTVDLKIAKKAIINEDEEVFDTNKYLPRIAELSIEQARGRKALFFLPNCRVSAEFVKLLCGLGGNARHVDSSYMNEAATKEVMNWYHGEKEAILCNASLLTTGYNHPPIDCIGIYRPFRSKTLLMQTVGRGTRSIAPIDTVETADERKTLIAASAKPSCRIVQLFYDNATVDFASVSQLITDDEETRKFLEKKRKPGQKFNIQDLQEQIAARKKMINGEEEMRKYAEKIANDQEKKRRDAVFIGDIIKYRNPTHKVAPSWLIRKVRALGAKIPDGTYSYHQLFRVEERIMKTRPKETA